MSYPESFSTFSTGKSFLEIRTIRCSGTPSGWDVGSLTGNSKEFSESGGLESELSASFCSNYSSFVRSTSDQSQLVISSPDHTDLSPVQTSPQAKHIIMSFASSSRVTLDHFLEQYLNPPTGKKPKPVPEWVFEVPEAQRRQLNQIAVFGIDLESNEDQQVNALWDGQRPVSDSLSSPGEFPTETKTTPSGPSLGADFKGKGKALASSHSPSFPRPAHIVPAASEPAATVYPPADESERDSDDEMPSRTATRNKRPRQDIFGTLNLPTSSPSFPQTSSGQSHPFDVHPDNDDSSHSESGDDDVDEIELSDYEREHRRQRQDAKLSGRITQSNPVRSQQYLSSSHASAAVSISASHQVSERSTISMQPGQGTHPSGILVDESEESAKTRESQQNSNQSSTNQSTMMVAGTKPPGGSQPSLKHQGNSSQSVRDANTSGEVQADDEDSHAESTLVHKQSSPIRGQSRSPRKRPPDRTSIRSTLPDQPTDPTPSSGSALGFLNPLNIFRSTSKSVKVEAQDIDSPLARRKEKNGESDEGEEMKIESGTISGSEGSKTFWKRWTGWRKGETSPDVERLEGEEYADEEVRGLAVDTQEVESHRRPTSQSRSQPMSPHSPVSPDKAQEIDEMEEMEPAAVWPDNLPPPPSPDVPPARHRAHKNLAQSLGGKSGQIGRSGQFGHSGKTANVPRRSFTRVIEDGLKRPSARRSFTPTVVQRSSPMDTPIRNPAEMVHTDFEQVDTTRTGHVPVVQQTTTTKTDERKGMSDLKRSGSRLHTPTTSGVEKVVKRAKLGGFKPDLSTYDGLRSEWVDRMTERAGQLREGTTG